MFSASRPDNFQGNIPLSDFFPYTQPQNFVPITVRAGFDASYFQSYFVNNPSESLDGPGADDD
jgi:hypothetical protein